VIMLAGGSLRVRANVLRGEPLRPMAKIGASKHPEQKPATLERVRIAFNAVTLTGDWSQGEFGSVRRAKEGDGEA